MDLPVGKDYFTDLTRMLIIIDKVYHDCEEGDSMHLVTNLNFI